jgi:molybdopterin molybdotransferase
VASSAVARRTLGYPEARERVLAAARPLAPETVPLAEAVGRALAQPVMARHALPPFRNSAMDGIAVRAVDLTRTTATAPALLRVTRTVPAGHVAPRALGERQAFRIMTGAMVPEGADAVIPVEEVEFLPGSAGEEQVRVQRPAAPGENIRGMGLDLPAGAMAVEAGRPLTPHDLALLAALGEARVSVGGRARVAVISTGDELLSVEQELTPGAIRDSNLPMLVALLEQCGAQVPWATRVRDDPERVGTQVREALEAADAVLTIGGVSAGDFDPVKLSLAAIPDVELWHVAMRPGRPQAFGTPRGRLFFGLPGNPASVACVFEALVRPALRRLQGCAVLDRPRLAVRAQTDIASRVGRTDFVRVTLEDRQGAWWAAPAGEQVSGHLAPQSRAHALLVIPAAADRLAAGEAAEAWVLRWPDPGPA